MKAAGRSPGRFRCLDYPRGRDPEKTPSHPQVVFSTNGLTGRTPNMEVFPLSLPVFVCKLRACGLTEVLIAK